MTTADRWVLGLAEGDCEAAVGGLLGQPANTISSLAFVAAGLWLLSRSHHDGGWRWGTLGWAAVAAGIGSVAYHGPMPPSGQFLHDIGLVSMPLTVGAIEVGVRRRGVPSMLAVLLPGLVVVAAILLAAPAATNPLTVAAAVWAGGGVLMAWLRAARPIRGLRWRPLLLLGVATGVGATLRFLGRTDAPLCDPTSILQAHAGWHVLAAAGVVAFAHAAYGVPSPPRPTGSRLTDATT